MRRLKQILLFVLLLTGLAAVFAYHYYRKGFATPHNKTKNNPAATSRVKSAAAELYSYAKKNGYSKEFCFLADMSLPAGKNRLFVYRFMEDSIISAGLVTHGRCNETWLTERKFDNSIGSGCTSLGRYKIANAYHGRFGLAYKLYGLDKTNSNAFARFVVLHSHECVPEKETDPYPICQSDGCPTVSPKYLKHLDTLLKKSRQPVLLYIFQ